MLIGGFQQVDMSKLDVCSEGMDALPLPFDVYGRYRRQVFTNNGRTATVYLLRYCMDLVEDDVLLLPDYLCHSVIVAIEHAGVKYRFYHIRCDLSIDMQSLNTQLDEHVKGIYIIPYFGMPYDEETVSELIEIRERTGIPIVEDVTQALLTVDQARIGFGNYIVASTRKWLPMTDGGLLAAMDGAPLPRVPLKCAYNEAAYKQLLISLIRTQYDTCASSDYLGYLTWEKEANRVRYSDLEVRGMTEFSRNVMFASNLEYISRRRRENYAYLYERLQGINGVTIVGGPMEHEGCVPFGLVVLVAQRDAFYEHMIRCCIVGEIQWLLPLEYYDPGADARYLSAHNLMLHCDQRYTVNDMQYIVQCVEAFFK